MQKFTKLPETNYQKLVIYEVFMQFVFTAQQNQNQATKELKVIMQMNGGLNTQKKSLELYLK